MTGDGVRSCDGPAAAAEGNQPKGLADEVRRKPRRWVIALVLLMMAFSGGWIYSQVRENRKLAWVHDLQSRGLGVSYAARGRLFGTDASTHSKLWQLLFGGQVTVHSEDPMQTKLLLSAPAFPGRDLHIMLPYEASVDEFAELKRRYPTSGLIIFSRATATGRQVW